MAHEPHDKWLVELEAKEARGEPLSYDELDALLAATEAEPFPEEKAQQFYQNLLARIERHERMS